MMMLTAKVDRKKLLILAAAVILTAALAVSLFGGGSKDAPEAQPTLTAATNEDRVQFLRELGWQVEESPTQTVQVKIPAESSEVFDRYNAMQKSQGYDLSRYAGKTVMRYVYQVESPEGSAPIYATLLVYQNQVIGGDVTDSAVGGSVKPLKNS